MKPGDIVRPLPGYSEMRDPPCGVIIERADLVKEWWSPPYRTSDRFNVLFPQGIFPMYSHEIEVISETG